MIPDKMKLHLFIYLFSQYFPMDVFQFFQDIFCIVRPTIHPKNYIVTNKRKKKNQNQYQNQF